MPRSKKGHPMHGWLILDKPSQITSTFAVGKIKRLFNAQKAGHAGTLDPLATGILPVALGEATKTVSFVMNSKKAYRFTVRWGIETSTDDVEGEIVGTSSARPAQQAIETQLQNFHGAIMQVPPRFSAIKIDGNRAYDLARGGEQVEIEARQVLIDKLELIDILDKDCAVFKAICGKGTYIRALARDLGRALGCLGHIRHLRRTQVGPFTEDDAWTLDKLELLVERGDGQHLKPKLSEPVLLPVEAVLKDLPQLELRSADAARIACGQGVIMRGRDAEVLKGQAYATLKGKLLALVEIQRGILRPIRVFNLSR